MVDNGGGVVDKMEGEWWMIWRGVVLLMREYLGNNSIT